MYIREIQKVLIESAVRYNRKLHCKEEEEWKIIDQQIQYELQPALQPCLQN